jgi:uncharacterized RDD family membrane protein YckC
MSREIKILTPENVELDFELAGLGSRFLALLLDSLLQSLVTAVLLLIALAIAYSVTGLGLEDSLGRLSPWVIAVLILFLFTLWSGYFLYFEAVRGGQTPGKKSVGIKVIRDTGHPLDFRAAVLRNLMRAVDMLPGMYGIAALSVFISPQYRRLGDCVGGTLVVKVRKEEWTAPSAARPAGVEQSTQPSPGVTTEPVVGLSDETLANLHLVTRDDYRAIRHFLDRRRELQTEVANSLAWKIVEPLAVKLNVDYVRTMQPVVFLEAVATEWERRMIR